MSLKRRTREQRQRDRAAGVDRFGRPLARTLGTNPRAIDGDGRAHREGRPAAGAEAAWIAPPPLRGRSVRTRRLALKRHCPKCLSRPGELCRGVHDQPRQACHASRYG